MKRGIYNHKSGFTLLEIIIYVGILGIVMYFVAGFLFNGFISSGKIEAWQDVNDTGRFVTAQILDAVHNSIEINGN